MLTIIVPAAECFNEVTSEIFVVPETKLQLEHSLISVFKWEGKWKKPFLSSTNLTNEELRDYVRCMTINQNVKPDVYSRLTRKNYDDISAYISDPQTATTIHGRKNEKKGHKQTVTAELIYYWMISLQIPVEFEKWPLSRLMTLIEVCNVKNSPGKKMSRKELLRENAALNASRRKRLGTSG